MSDKKPSLENWEDFSGKYFKAEHARGWPAITKVVSVDSRYNDDDFAVLICEINYLGKTYLYEPNITNLKKIKDTCKNNPKELIGQNFSFQKVKARNPKTGQTVDSLEIEKIS